nr:hypothetical protein [Tanacetum cinerariifolium]
MGSSLKETKPDQIKRPKPIPTKRPINTPSPHLEKEVGRVLGVNTANGVNTASSQVNVVSAFYIDNLSDAVICAFLASQPNSTQLVNKDLEQIHLDDLKEMNLKWQMTMLTMRARRFFKNTGRKLNLNGNDSVAFAKPKWNSIIVIKEATLQENVGHQEDRTTRVEMLQERLCQDRALIELQRKLDLAKTKKEGIQLNVNKLENASKSLNKIIECQIMDNCKKELGYNAVPPPHKGLFPSLKSDLSSTGLEELFNEAKTKKSKDKSTDAEPESVRKDSDAPIIKD